MNIWGPVASLGLGSLMLADAAYSTCLAFGAPISDARYIGLQLGGSVFLVILSLILRRSKSD